MAAFTKPGLVLEERLSGRRSPCLPSADGRTMVLLPLGPGFTNEIVGRRLRVPKHRRMGAYALAPLLDADGLERVRQLVLEPTLRR